MLLALFLIIYLLKIPVISRKDKPVPEAIHRQTYFVTINRNFIGWYIKCHNSNQCPTTQKSKRPHINWNFYLKIKCQRQSKHFSRLCREISIILIADSKVFIIVYKNLKQLYKQCHYLECFCCLGEWGEHRKDDFILRPLLQIFNKDLQRSNTKSSPNHTLFILISKNTHQIWGY